MLFFPRHFSYPLTLVGRLYGAKYTTPCFLRPAQRSCTLKEFLVPLFFLSNTVPILRKVKRRWGPRQHSANYFLPLVTPNFFRDDSPIAGYG